ncbi:putative proetin [Ruminiclostridium cellobioparum subsp. termitidis CT1112]|uniref:Putative proetin n=1 Tax=Ruminiclostridium cellobioparum subsp. termitidis CT1112 TaxID=1195236 RepID=S0FK45_RUMCE|nr:putative proetin [Ruminiclostridium cellobioparum subsp. termitidis CT1112]
MSVMVVIIYAILAIYEFIPLYKEKKWADFVVNAVLWTSSLIIVLLLCFNVEIPSPQAPVRKFIESIFGKQG